MPVVLRLQSKAPLNPIFQRVEADDRARESGEGVMDVASAFVARDEPAEVINPGERAFKHSSVAVQILAGLEPYQSLGPLLAVDAGRHPSRAPFMRTTYAP